MGSGPSSQKSLKERTRHFTRENGGFFYFLPPIEGYSFTRYARNIIHHLSRSDVKMIKESSQWLDVLRLIEKRLNKPSYDTWFKHTRAVIEGDYWTIIAPNEFARDWLENQHKRLIEDAILETTNSKPHIFIFTEEEAFTKNDKYIVAEHQMEKEDASNSYTDYTDLHENIRTEIIDGVPYMQTAPSRIHQEILSELHRQIANFLVGEECKVYPAPFHVCLNDDSRSVVEPDISIICDTSKLNEHGCIGSPDMIIEITSPSTARKDKLLKFHKYEEAGVKEYWIIEPQEKIVSVFTLGNQKYGRPNLYSEEDQVQVSILDGLKIDLSMVFTY